tara:strand:- start:1708 stop:2961 length:1254 start_codon:yes stop_codon:yes gene_type:complete
MKSKEIIKQIAINAKKASSQLSNIESEIKNKALRNLIKNIKDNSFELIKANKKDIENANSVNLSSAKIDRLMINENRIDGIVKSLEEIINIKDPVGRILSEWNRPNGLKIKKVSVPIGVIGIIYESRPNVTVDASAITIKSGNAVILRGGKDSFFSSQKLVEIIRNSFLQAGLPENTVQIVPIPDRSAVDELLELDSYIDLIIPRGGKNLIQKIKEKSSIPVIKHLDGICHVYIDKDADISIAKNVLYNSKMRRPGICGAAETLLIDKSIIKDSMEILQELLDNNCEIRGDSFIQTLNKNIKRASEEDWKTEYLDKIISVKIVDGVKEAIDHINSYSSGHTESIITNNNKTFEFFSKNINSAIILNNASTQFADGGEFGFGAEIGISTDKLHVRGPVGVEHLTTFKYIVHGDGQVRP